MVASVIKTYELSNLGHRNDFTWNTPVFFIWVAVELNIVIIAASLPTLKAIFRRINEGSSASASARNRSYELYGHSRWDGPDSRIPSQPASSEENFLPIENSYAIRKTVDVSVTSALGNTRAINR